jgi:methanethiol S-methyltransferase
MYSNVAISCDRTCVKQVIVAADFHGSLVKRPRENQHFGISNSQRATASSASSVLYGIVAYATFLISLPYAISPVGDMVVPKSIDSGTAGPPLAGLLVDALLLGLFAVQHCVMARQGFRRWWTRFVPRPVERSTYVLLASLVLLILYWQWRPIPEAVWTVQNPVAVAVNAIFWFGWGTLPVSTILISHFELFGLNQVFARLLGREPPAPRSHTPLLYRPARHPIYLGFLLAFLAAPSMTVDHLLFSVATTGYILIAIQFEARDFIELFGEQYRHYRQNVATLLPLPGRKLGLPRDAQVSSPKRSVL